MNRMKSKAGALALIHRNVGRFAGSFSLITDDLVSRQRRHYWESGELNYQDYTRTFWASGGKAPTY